MPQQMVYERHGSGEEAPSLFLPSSCPGSFLSFRPMPSHFSPAESAFCRPDVIASCCRLPASRHCLFACAWWGGVGKDAVAHARGAQSERAVEKAVREDIFQAPRSFLRAHYLFIVL